MGGRTRFFTLTTTAAGVTSFIRPLKVLQEKNGLYNGKGTQREEISVAAPYLLSPLHASTALQRSGLTFSFLYGLSGRHASPVPLEVIDSLLPLFLAEWQHRNKSSLSSTFFPVRVRQSRSRSSMQYSLHYEHVAVAINRSMDDLSRDDPRWD